MADKVYAVIDTNVIVSALISKKAESYPFSVMAHVYSGVIIPVFNNEIINEYKDVLSREKFQNTIFHAACWARRLWAAFILPKFHFTPKSTYRPMIRR